MALEHWLDWVLDVVLSPTAWLSLTLALIYGVLFFVWSGGGRRQLIRDLLASLIGFGIGHVAGVFSGTGWLQLGQVQLFWGTLGAVIALVLGRRFIRKRTM